MYLLIKFFVNIFLITFLKLFTSSKVSFGANIHPNTFYYIWKNKIPKINFGKAYIGGNKVCISEGVKFFDRPIIFGNINIGRYTSINGPSTRICSNINEVKIGSFCSIASNVVIQEYYHNVNLTTTYNILSNIIKDKDWKIQVVSKGNIIIEDDVWIGSNVSILSGIKIGRGAVIGAGSVVTKDIPAYSIAAGNPCKVIKDRFNESTVRTLEESKWWEWDVKEICKHSDFFKIDRNLHD